MNRLAGTLVLCIVMSWSAHAGAAGDDDAAACGRKAVAEDVGSGQVDEYVRDCVEQRKAARAAESGDTAKGKAEKQMKETKEKSRGDAEKKMKDKARSKVK